MGKLTAQERRRKSVQVRPVYMADDVVQPGSRLLSPGSRRWLALGFGMAVLALLTIGASVFDYMTEVMEWALPPLILD